MLRNANLNCKGTLTLTQLWNDILADPNTEQFETLPVICPDRLISQTEFTSLVTGTCKDEAAMYDPILDTLGGTSTRSTERPIREVSYGSRITHES